MGIWHDNSRSNPSHDSVAEYKKKGSLDSDSGVRNLKVGQGADLALVMVIYSAMQAWAVLEESTGAGLMGNNTKKLLELGAEIALG